MMVRCISVVLTAGIFGASALSQQKSRPVAQETRADDVAWNCRRLEGH